jgi:signal transduction histidine kinase
MPIRQRLFYIFSITTVLMMLLLAGYTILTVQRHLENAAFQRLKETARQLYDQYRKDPARTLQLVQEKLFPNDCEVYFTSGTVLPFGSLFPDTLPDEALRMTTSPQTLYSFTHDTWLYVVSHWPLMDSRLVLRKERREVGAALRPIRHIVYTGMLISTALIFLVSAWTSRSLAKPILQIADAAEAIAAGDQSRTLTLERNDEFGRMAASLNRMAERLRQESAWQREVSQRLQHFQSDLAHEVRNPLHALNTSVEMLALPDLPEESKKRHLQIVKTQSERLNRLFTDLLTLQKFDAGETPLQRTAVALQPLVENVMLLHNEAIRNKGLQTEIAVNETVVFANADRLEQILENLISNAVKFSEKGCIRVWTKPAGTDVEIHVTDEGIGIPPDAIDHIFDRFYRVDSSRSRNSGGSGLGLAVVKSLLKAHGAEIFVNSRVDVGSDFYFRLPKA